MIEPFGVRATVGDGPLDVYLSKGLKSWPIYDAGGDIIARVHGLLLEDWLGEGLSMHGSEIHVASTIADPTDFAARVIEGLAGLLLIETLGGPLGRRLYMDCGGTIPLVYCPETRAIGSSAYQLFDAAEYDRRLLHDRINKLVRKEGADGWISGTLTAHRGVERLLCNHYLDLDSFTQHRFWPRADLLNTSPPSFEEASQAIAAAMTGYTSAAAGRYRTGVALTAGFDSRLVLASARGVKDSIFCYTTMGVGKQHDREIPLRISRELGLEHRAFNLVRASPEEMEHWDRLVGHFVDAANREFHPSLASLDAEVALSGLYGEPGRGTLYSHDWETINTAPADAPGILARVRQPRDTELEEDVATWLGPIAHLPRSTVLDLAYLELWMCSWAMGQAPAQRPIVMSLMPFAQWKLQNLFLIFPLQEKISGQLLRRAGEIMWPELMEFPINRLGDWRDRLGPVKQLMRVTNWKKAQRYLRKHMAR